MGRSIVKLLVVVITGLGFLLGGAALADERPTSSRIPLTPLSARSGESVVVASGDHLWKISDRHLHATFGHNPTNREILPYWLEVIDVNRPTLRSGNPNLIYPGEVVRLPAVIGRP